MKIVSINVFLVYMALIAITTSQPTNFDYDTHGDNWSGSCNQGLDQQSPIVLKRSDTISDKASFLFADFHPTQAQGTVYNTTIYIKPTDFTTFFGQVYTMTIDDKPVPFKAFEIRLRTQSEHRIQTQQGAYDLELQINMKQLYDSSKNMKLSVGLLFKAEENNKDDPFLTQVINKAGDLNESFNLNVDLSHLLYREELFNFWFYLGSTTMPPCTNAKLYWIIPDKIFKMSSEQLKFFQNLYPKGNWRKVQPSNKNQVGYARNTLQSQQQF